MTGFRYRLVDIAGCELAIVSYGVPNMSVGDTVHLPGGRGVTVVEVYNEEVRRHASSLGGTRLSSAGPKRVTLAAA